MRHLLAWGFAYWCVETFGLWVGFSIFMSRDVLQAQVYGYPITGMAGLIIGYAVILPILEHIYHGMADRLASFSAGQRGARSTRLIAVQPIEDIEAMFDRGTETLLYEGKINRSYKYDRPGGNGNSVATERIRLKYALRRNLAAMPHREREAARILYVMEHEGLIDSRKADELKFALIYGDGRASVSVPDMKLTHRLMVQHNLKSTVDLVKAEASYTGASMDGAISDLHHNLQKMTGSINPAVQRLQSRIMGGGGFSVTVEGGPGVSWLR